MSEHGPRPVEGRHPYLHGHVVCVRAPAQWISPGHGDCLDGVDGLYVADRRALARLAVTVDGERPVPIGNGSPDAAHATFVSVVRTVAETAADPLVLCRRVRQVDADGGRETLSLANRARHAVRLTLEVTAGTDLAPVGDVRAARVLAPLGADTGRAAPATANRPLAAEPLPDGLAWRAPDGVSVTLRADAGPAVDPAGRLRWELDLEPGGTREIELRVAVSPPDGPIASAADGGAGFRPMAPAGPAPWLARPLVLRADDHRAGELVARSVADLEGLLLCDPAEPADGYFAAGSPWYLTLFGRDALWSALMALPLGVGTLAGTLRTLARRQGERVDAGREEAPGKIPHELRPADAAVWLPPVYYGTVDATPLFVTALAEAWRWGMPAAEVAALLPHAERALHWMREHGDPDGDGFLEYLPSGHGLVNQGWKDSADAVQWADGRLAEGPVALCEVQGYAYRAAVDGAALLEAYDRPGADAWRVWAGELAERFRAAYWVSDADGRYPAIALDGAKQAVDAPASNMGHLLGTGLLDRAEEGAVARRLLGPSLACGYGLRTMADTAAGFNPLSYHGGSVWPHDTAIAALGLARARRGRDAAALLAQLVEAAPHLGYRLPELYGGQRREPGMPPLAYPPACFPQAWAAAVGPVLVRVLLGLDVDVPARRLRLAPVAAFGAFEVSGVEVAGEELAVRVDRSGSATVLRAPRDMEILVAG